jgi:hypothetical protein
LSKSRIKRLRGVDSPHTGRVGEFRVFYDVAEDEDYILRVLSKPAVAEYLKEMGMKLKTVTIDDLSTRTGKVMEAARRTLVLVRAPGKAPLILRALVDDDAADELLMRSPTFRASIRAGRRNRKAGKGISIAEARRRLRV